MPWACRRSAYGSCDPVGTRPTPRQPTTVSILSAMARIDSLRRPGELVLRAPRQVLLPNGSGHGGALAGAQRVRLADDALKLGKLPDHTRRPDPSSTRRAARTAAARTGAGAGRGQVLGQRLHSLGLLEQASQPLLEDHRGQPGQSIRRGGLQILAEVEVGVRKASADDPLVATPDLGRIAAWHVGDGHEEGGQASVGVSAVKQRWWRRMGVSTTARGRSRKACRQRAHHRHRPLHQVDHGLQGGLVDHGRKPWRAPAAPISRRISSRRASTSASTVPLAESDSDIPQVCQR